MTECNEEKIALNCACTYISCSRRGKCCECISYHLKNNELPGCAFAKISKAAEESYARSFKNFARLVLRE